MKVRLIVIDADMSVAEIFHAIAPAVHTPAAVEIVKQLAAPKLPGEPPRRTKPARPSATRAAKTGAAKTGAANTVRQALQDGPKTAAQIRDWLRHHDHPSLTKSVPQVIWSLIKQREIRRDPNTGLCHLVS